MSTVLVACLWVKVLQLLLEQCHRLEDDELEHRERRSRSKKSSVHSDERAVLELAFALWTIAACVWLFELFDCLLCWIPFWHNWRFLVFGVGTYLLRAQLLAWIMANREGLSDHVEFSIAWATQTFRSLLLRPELKQLWAKGQQAVLPSIYRLVFGLEVAKEKENVYSEQFKYASTMPKAKPTAQMAFPTTRSRYRPHAYEPHDFDE